LFAIAQTAGGEWPNRVEKAVNALTDKSDESESAGVLLLADIRSVLVKRKERYIASRELVERLIALEDRPWCEFGRTGKPLTQRTLANLLRPFGISSGSHRIGNTTFKGYPVDKFHDAFKRYLPPPDPDTSNDLATTDSSVTPSQPPFQSHSDANLSATNTHGVTDRKTLKPAPQLRCDGVTDRNGGDGAKPWIKPDFEKIPNPPEGIPWRDQYSTNSTGGPWSMRI